MSKQQPGGRIHVSFKHALGLLLPYMRDRIMAQINSVALIVLYLVLFQTLILQIPVAEAVIIAIGISLVVFGLAFYMEGLLLGIMPLGEVIGIKMPQKSKLPVMLGFALVLGVGVTLAEPAIGILKAAGAFLKPWEAPLLYLLLNKCSNYLVIAVGTGVGLAVVFGVLRFLYNWSLKPLLYVCCGILLPFTVWAYFDPNIMYLSSVAWDCGGVTTGPVTVPLVLALGIGICRVVGTADSGTSGFGVVSLASLFPILTVMILGVMLMGSVPNPMPEAEFFNEQNRTKVVSLFQDENQMIGYALANASEKSQLQLFDGDPAKLQTFLQKARTDANTRQSAFGSAPKAFERWAATKATYAQALAVFGNETDYKKAVASFSVETSQPLMPGEMIARNFKGSLQAIVPLVAFLMIVLMVVLREKLPRADEIALGVLLSLIGMGLFNVGMEIGLAKLGNQVGGMLPSSFQSIPMENKRCVIAGFDTALVQSAITTQGNREKFFYTKVDDKYQALPFQSKHFDAVTKQYVYTPAKGPLFGKTRGIVGILVVLFFAFVMGYGATLAEPALNALGLTVEELSVGTIKKVMIMQAVAIGVGVGMMMGLVKIIWNVPLIFLLAPPYLVLLVLTKFSTEEFVNIGWDSGGVTTGPITVPLVIAMGLGIGNQIGVVEGFGILALASVYPILSMLFVGLLMKRKQEHAVREAMPAIEQGVTK